MKLCPKCNTEHYNDGVFCSRSCANSRGPRTEEFKKKVSEKLIGRVGKPNLSKGKFLVDRIGKNCPVCAVNFKIKINSKKMYCSDSCWRKVSGGYRNGSGRAKTGYYKGIYCGSTYELVWVIYNIDHNIVFDRFPGYVQFNGIKYYPDFLIDKTIIEIKGYENQDSVDKKTYAAEQNGYSVRVLRKDDLKLEFDWVVTNYEYKELCELYDDYKPQYSLKCSCCSNTFNRNKKPKTDIVFCSRKCAGEGHKGRKNVSID